MGPTGAIMEPMGPLSRDAAAAMFLEQAEALREGGADVLWVETISALQELHAAADAIAELGMPWCVTMSFDTAGRTMMGVTAADMVRAVEALPHPPIAFGANCGTGASDLLRTVLGFAAQGPERPLIAKGNAGIPKFVDGHIHYDGTPELMADYARLARDCGAHDHRRLLRHHARAPADDARGAGGARTRPAPDARDHRPPPRRLLLAGRRQRRRPRPPRTPPPPRLRIPAPDTPTHLPVGRASARHPQPPALEPVAQSVAPVGCASAHRLRPSPVPMPTRDRVRFSPPSITLPKERRSDPWPG